MGKKKGKKYSIAYWILTLKKKIWLEAITRYCDKLIRIITVLLAIRGFTEEAGAFWGLTRVDKWLYHYFS